MGPPGPAWRQLHGYTTRYTAAYYYTGTVCSKRNKKKILMDHAGGSDSLGLGNLVNHDVVAKAVKLPRLRQQQPAGERAGQ